MITKLVSNNNIEQYKDQIINHFSSMSKEDIYLRFMRRMNEYLLNDWFDNIVNNDHTHHLFVLLLNDDNIVKGIGQLSIGVGNLSGELALSIDDEVKGNGYASQIMSILISEAKRVNLKEVIIMCNRNNHAMYKIAKNNNFFITYEYDDFVGTLAL